MTKKVPAGARNSVFLRWVAQKKKVLGARTPLGEHILVRFRPLSTKKVLGTWAHQDSPGRAGRLGQPNTENT